MDVKVPFPPQGNEKDPPKYPAAGTASAPNPAFRTTFACVSLHMRDRIRLLRFPSADTDRIKQVIQQAWPRGIQDLRAYDASDEIKLYGNPWSPSSWFNDERINARRLICRLLGGLFDMGWILKAAVDISKKEFDKDTLLFRLQQPPPPPCTWMSISFDRGDTMNIIDAPPELGPALVRAYSNKIQRHRVEGPVFEIKFRGYPWRANGVETVHARVILLVLLEILEQHGFSLYASIDQDNGPGHDSHYTEADAWYCNRSANWTPGVPIYHS